MNDTKPTETSPWYNQLLEHPFLLGILIPLAIVVICLLGVTVYLLFRPAGGVGSVPTPPIQFATPTTSPGDTVTPPLTGGGSIALLSVQSESGTLITITGKNWTPNDKLVIKIEAPGSSQNLQPLFASATVAADGSFITSFILPKNSAWVNLTSVQVTVESTTTGQRVSAEFSIVDPSFATPTVSGPPPASATPGGPTATPTTQYIPSPGEWTAEYFANPNLSGSPVVVRNELGVDFDWGYTTPAPDLPEDGFSARWTRAYNFDAGVYRFHLFADDGVRLWINDKLIINEWYPSAPRELTVDYPIEYAGSYVVRIEYTDFNGIAVIRFWWEKIGGPLPPPGPPYDAWRGAYWPNVDLFGDPLLVREDPSINFDWGSGPPAPGLPANNFSIRWDRLLDFESANYRFYLTVNDGARLWVDGRLLIDEWRDGDTREVSRDFAMSGGTHELRVEYYKRSGNGVVKLRWEKTPIPTATHTPVTSFPDWKGEYWSNINLAGQPSLLRNDPAINFNWGFGSPDSAIPSDGFSVRWSRSFTFENGLHRFTVESNDGIRFFLDGSLILNEWSNTSTTRVNTFDLNLSGRHWLVVEYYENTGEAAARLQWIQISVTSTPTPTATPSNTPTGTTTPTTTPTQTFTPSPTITLTHTPTGTATASPTVTGTITPTATTVITSTATITATP